MTIKRIRKANKGYTLIELLVVIAIIGILATIGIASYAKVQSSSRNSQRMSKITVVSEALEKYYDQNGAYPNCTVLTSTTTATSTLKGLDPNALTTPSGSTFEVGTAGQTLSSDQFACIGNGSDYKLQYLEEGTGITKTISSRRVKIASSYTLTYTAGPHGTIDGNSSTAQTVLPNASGTAVTASSATYYDFTNWSDGSTANPRTDVNVTADISVTANFVATPISPPAAPNVSANTVGATTTWSWPVVSCGTNSVKYQYRYLIDSVVVLTPEWNTQSASSVSFTTSTIGHTYTVDVQAQCYNAAISSSWSGSGTDSYYRPTIAIPVPSPAPTVVVDSQPTSTTTRWRWSTTATCQSGSSLRYQYKINYTGFDPAWTSPVTATTVDYTTSTKGLTYTVYVQAQCYNSTTGGVSDWSASGWASYTRPNTYTLTYFPCSGGSILGNNPQTVTSGGSGTAVTAVPPAFYNFVNWSDGSTSNPRTDTNVTTNKSFTANCALTAIPQQSPPTVYVAGQPSGYTTRWAWYANSSCPSGSSMQYQYYFDYAGYWTGPVTSTSADFTTSTPGAYTLYVSDQCYNATTGGVSDWSGYGSDSYTRSYPYYTLTYSIGTGKGSLSGSTWQSVISGGSGTAVSATAGMCYDGVSWSDGSTTTSRTDTNITSDRSYTVNFTNSTWYPGVAGTQLEGQCVKKTDLSSKYQFKTSDTTDTNNDHAQTGIDNLNNNYWTLVNPFGAAGSSLTWGSYPAQQECKAVGGRLPWSSELSAILSSSGAYGNNFKSTDAYRSAAQNPNNGTQAVNRTLNEPVKWGVSAKTEVKYVRCVTGVGGPYN